MEENKPKIQVNVNCRFYEKRFPEEGELVMVQVINVVENGAYVALLEYDNIEGMIIPNEFSKIGNMRLALKSIKVGKQEIVRVLRVDAEKEYIDLSKKRVANEEIAEFEEKFNHSQKVNSILRAVAEKCTINIEDLYKTIAWPLYKTTHHHPFDAFKSALEHEEEVLGKLEIPKEARETLMSEIKRRMTVQPFKIRADFELSCFAYEGIDAIKDALRAGLAKCPASLEIKFQVIAPPLYVAVTNTVDKNQGIHILNEALKTVEDVIKSKQGIFTMKVQPCVVGDKGDADIHELINKLEQNSVGSHTEEEEDEGMDADIGVDTEEIDKQESLRKKHEDDEEEKKGTKE